MRATSRAHLARLSLVLVPFAIAAGAAFLSSACRVTALDIGADQPRQPDAQELPDSSVPDAEADASSTLESRLRARCAEEPGRIDDYFSGAGLTARLDARWFNCGSAPLSPIQDGDGDGIVFRADGSWALLFWNAKRDGFDASTTPLQFGMTRYHFFVDPEAGAAADSGIGPGDIEHDDTRNRTPLVVYLGRFGSPDGFNHTFSKLPRQMTVVESASPLRAQYVPID